MTASQKLAIRSSEIRSRLNEISGLAPDAVTDEVKTESEALRAELGTVETQHRAALTVEGAAELEAEGQFGNGDGEPAEVRALLSKVTIGDYLAPAAAGTGIHGAAVELAGALSCATAGASGGVAVPWRVLAGGAPEARSAPPVERRAFTTTGNNDGSTMQRPILQRLFGPGIMDTLGVRLDTVPTGMSEWPLVTGGVAPAQAKEGTAAAAAAAMTFSFATLKPKRLTGRYEYSHEMAASVSDLEQAIRRDLADAIKSAMSSQIINSAAPTAAIPQNILGGGFLTKLGVPGDAGATSDYEDYAGAHAGGIDGIHAETEREVSSVIAVDVYQHAATTYQTGSGESGSEALSRRSAGCRASSYIPAAVANTGQAKHNIFHLGGANGGAMRGDSIAAMWPTLEVIRDIYSQASQGVTLTWVTLWDASVAFRAAAYQRLAFKIT